MLDLKVETKDKFVKMGFTDDTETNTNEILCAIVYLFRAYLDTFKDEKTFDDLVEEIKRLV